MVQFPLNLHLYKIFMTIEPEALYSLFDTLFLPAQIKEIKESDVPKTNENKRILMLFGSKPSKDESEFLNKILAAINVKPDEVESVFESNSESLSQIIENSSGYVLAWGTGYQETEKYGAAKIGKCSLIISDSLTEVKNDQTLKAKLWNCLKKEFVK